MCKERSLQELTDSVTEAEQSQNTVSVNSRAKKFGYEIHSAPRFLRIRGLEHRPKNHT